MTTKIEAPKDVAERLIRELEYGIAEMDLRAWAREAAPILGAAAKGLPLLDQITETLDLGAKIHPGSEVHRQLKSLSRGA